MLCAVRRFVVFPIVICLLSSQSTLAQHPGLDCLVQVDIRYAGSAPFWEIRRSWIEFLRFRRLDGIDKPGGIAYARESRQRMYVLAGRDCANKVRNVQALITEFLFESHISGLEMTVGDPVDPSIRVKRAFSRPPPPKYARRDCIVKFEAFGQKRTDKWVALEGRNYLRFMLNYVERRYPRISPFVASGHNNIVFIIFLENCHRRIWMAKELTSAYMGTFPSGPRFIVHEYTIEPHNDTINVSGPYWTDTAKPAPSRKP